MVGAKGLRSAGFATAIAAVVLAAPAHAEGAPCPAVWPPRAPDRTVTPLTPEGLLALRDIAQPADGAGASSPLAISPDRSKVALFVTQAVLDANDTCESLLVIEVDNPGQPKVVDSGGRAIRYEQAIRGMRYSSGVLEANIPVWSADNRTLVFRKRVQGRTQAWIARLDGFPARQLTNAEQDVEGVGWSADGRVLYSVRPGRSVFAAARDDEGRRGFLYDARFAPPISAQPQLPADLPLAVMAIPLDGGAASPASAADRAAFNPPIAVADKLVPARGRDGQVADAAPAGPQLFAPTRIHVRKRDGSRTECLDGACTGALRSLWWHGDEVMFVKRDGWHREDSVVAAWSPERGTVRTILRGREKVSGCASTQGGILCIAEDSRHPRRVIMLDPVSGARRDFFDPNPDLDIAGLPPVERLRWRNALGLEAWADLVLPPGPPPPGGWPVVIVQYRSDGFLRGGTGDEYPVFPLVARGIAVFSFDEPDFPPSDFSRADDIAATLAALNRNWSYRRSVHDSLMTGLDLALAGGQLDPARIGITGLSDGSTSARFALINRDRFAAASISTCCIEPFNIMALGGPAVADWFRRVGFPDASRPDPDFWRPGSMALNAERMDTPMLMQLADTEFIDGLETVTALSEHHKPVELYVFPDEYHIKSQPVHRAAIYERNLDWFAFWLKGEVDPDPTKAEQYRRWGAMKAGRQAGPSRP